MEYSDLKVKIGYSDLKVANSLEGERYILLNKKENTVSFSIKEPSEDNCEIVIINTFKENLKINELRRLVYDGLICYFCPYQSECMTGKENKCRKEECVEFVPKEFIRNRVNTVKPETACYHTKRQLWEMKRVPKKGALENVMRHSKWYPTKSSYYLDKETRPMNKKELLKYENERQKNKKEINKKRKGKRKLEKAYQKISNYTGYCRDVTNDFKKVEQILEDPESNIVVYDIETTGLELGMCGILQVAMVNQHGDVLLNEYFNPGDCRWNQEAIKINGITPEDVTDKEFISEKWEKIQHIFDKADLIVGYNSQSFDDKFMLAEGFRVVKNCTK